MKKFNEKIMTVEEFFKRNPQYGFTTVEVYRKADGGTAYRKEERAYTEHVKLCNGGYHYYKYLLSCYESECSTLTRELEDKDEQLDSLVLLVQELTEELRKQKQQTEDYRNALIDSQATNR